MDKKFVGFLAVVVLLGLLAVPVLAATPEEIEASIVLGLEWLADEQEIDGSWTYEGGPDPGATGIVLLKFEDRAKELELNPLAAEYTYRDNVQNGLNYLFSQMIVEENGISIDGWNYYTSIALMALSASNNPNAVVAVPGGSAVDGMTYAEVAQGLLDWVIAAQATSGCAEGGWSYYPEYTNWADQSNSGYSVLSMTQAGAASPDGFGLTIPDATKTELLVYLANVQDTNGGSIYEPCVPYSWINILKTGNLLQEHAFAGTPVDDPAVVAAIGYIEANWDNTGTQPDAFVDTSWGWKDSYQAMFCMMKGLESYEILQLDLDHDGIPEADWFDEVSTQIIDHQNLDGSFQWIDDGGELIYEGDEDPNLRTAWALLTLEKFVPPPPPQIKEVYVDIKPGSCPNSFNVKDKGVLPVAILGEEDFDVTTIDPASIRLVSCGFGLPEDPEEDFGLAPITWDYEKVAEPHDMMEPEEGDNICDAEYCDISDCWAADPPVCTAWRTVAPFDCIAWDYDTGDEYQDLTLKFDTQAVVEELELTNGQGCVKAKIVGNLLSEDPEETGLPLFGYDNLRVLLTGGKK